jgi:hypothetical protein
MKTNNEIIAEFDRLVLEFKKGLVLKQLNQCTLEQQELFNKMYKSLNSMPEAKMRWAYGQCGRSAEENKESDVRLSCPAYEEPA